MTHGQVGATAQQSVAELEAQERGLCGDTGIKGQVRRGQCGNLGDILVPAVDSGGRR